MIKISIKIITLLILCLFIGINTTITSQAANNYDSEIKTKIIEVMNNLQKAANSHNINEVSSYYSNEYLSNDNLTKDQIVNLIKETWKAYPDIHYTSDLTDIRYSDDWATVESHDSYLATTAEVSNITEDKGSLSSKSHSVIYLRRIGKSWKIVGDLTYYERATIKYGSAKNLDVLFSTPEQVKASQMYSAKISMDVPVGTFAVGSINQEPIIYPFIKHKEKFRTINQNIGFLERVFEANEDNVNELISATIGITELTEDNQARPTVKLKGICVITQRVNVIPESKFVREDYILTHKESLSSSEKANIDE